MGSITRFFETRFSTILCVVLSVACRIISVLYSSYAGGDKYSLAVQSKDLLQGKGLSIPKYFISTLDQPVYDHTPLWPPGYPLLLTPFLRIFNYDLYWATTSVDIIVSIGFIFVIRKICQQITFPTVAVNLMTLIAGCFQYPFIVDSLPTDAISLLFFLIGISFSLKLVSPEFLSTKYVFLSGLFLFLACAFRYSYLPLAFLIPILIALYGWKSKVKPVLSNGLRLAVFTFLAIGALLIILKFSTGQATYVTPDNRGFFPENLSNWYPVTPAAFIDLPFFSSQVAKYTSINVNTQLGLLQKLNIVVVIFLFVTLCYVLFIRRVFRNIDAFKWFTFLLIFSTILTFLILAYLSLTHEAQHSFTYDWTYIMEGRYFAIFTLLIQLLFLYWIFINPTWKKKVWQKIIVFICSLLLFIEVSHSLYFFAKVGLDFTKYKSAVFVEQDYNYFKKLLPSLTDTHPNFDILVTSPNDKCYQYIATYFNKKGIYDGYKLKETSLNVKAQSLLVLILFDEELQEYQKFLSENKAQLIHEINNTNFYLIELLPSK